MQLKSAATYVEKADLIFVQNFAKDTGDFKSLSMVDQLVIALGVRLAKERGDFALLRSEPKPLQEFKPAQFTEDYQRQEDSDDSGNKIEE